MKEPRKIFHESRGKSPESWGKYMCRNIHVELCSSRKSEPLVPLPSASSLPTQKPTPTTSTKFSSLFLKKSSPIRLERTRIFPYCTTTAHTAAATVLRLDNFDYNFIPARDWPSNSPNLSSIGYSINGIFQAPTSEAEGTQREAIETSHAPGVVKNIRVMAFRLNTWSHFLFILSGEKGEESQD